MADIKLIKFSGQFQNEHDPASDSVQMVSFKTATKELTDAKLALLIDGADAADEHIHDGRYFPRADFIDNNTAPDSDGKPIMTDENGMLNLDFLDLATMTGLMSHSSLQNLDADDHLQYLNRNGSRPMTADLDMDGNHILLTSDPTLANHATNKAYVDSVATGLRPKGNVVAATTVDLDATYDNGINGAGATLTANNNVSINVDTIDLNVGDRVLVKDQVSALENGIYEVTVTGSAEAPFVLTRSADQDNTPLQEVTNGVFIPKVISGAVNAGKPFVIISVGTGPNKEHVLGTDSVIWDEFTSPAQLTAGDGIVFDGNNITVALAENRGIIFESGELAVNPNDIAGAGLLATLTELEIDWAADFTIDAAEVKAISADSLASTSNGLGASIVGVEDANSYFVGNNQEAVNNELYLLAKAGGGVEYIVGAGGVSKGDLLFVSANNTVLPYDDLSLDENVIGVALETVGAGNPVQVAKFDKLLTGVLTAATAGEVYYWDGTAFTTSPSDTAGEHVYLVGVAKNATDLALEIRHLYQNS